MVLAAKVPSDKVSWLVLEVGTRLSRKGSINPQLLSSQLAWDVYKFGFRENGVPNGSTTIGLKIICPTTTRPR